MSRWKRDDGAGLVALTVGVPDAVAVFEDGVLVGFDESTSHGYALEHGLATVCDAECVALGFVAPV